jgi:hypothetical protein
MKVRVTDTLLYPYRFCTSCMSLPATMDNKGHYPRVMPGCTKLITNVGVSRDYLCKSYLGD